MSQDIDRIYDKLNTIENKLDSYALSQATNTNDIKWIKRAGAALITILGFLGTQLYAELTIDKDLPPIILNDKGLKNDER